MKKAINYVMISIYLLAGLFLIFSGWFLLSEFQNTGMGILLIAYAVFRAVRTYYSEKADKNLESEERENI